MDQQSLIEQLSQLKLMRSLMRELQDIDEEAWLPPEELSRTDTVLIREIPVPMRRIWALFRSYQRRLDDFLVSHKWSSQEDKNATWFLGTELEYKIDLLQVMFWISLNEEYNAWHVKRMGIRRPWVLVENNRNDGPNLPKSFKDLLGL